MADGSVELFPCRNDRRMQLEMALVTRPTAGWLCRHAMVLDTGRLIGFAYSRTPSEWIGLTSLVRQSARL